MPDPESQDTSFTTSFGLPRPRWDLIRPRVFAEQDPVRRHELWCHAQREWLKILCAALQQPYQIRESEHFLLLTAARGDVTWLTDYAEQARKQIIGLLGAGVASLVGKLAVLIFAGEAEYRRYIRHFSKGGRPILSAGAWVMDGDAHIAISGVSGFKEVLVHELVHAHLADLPRPRWLHEGLAQHVTRQLVTRQRLTPGSALRQELRLFWRPRTLDSFWSGDAFEDTRPHGAQPYAYELANLLVLEMASLSHADLRHFALAATQADAGAAAARDVYGFGLETWARAILGDGDWAPGATGAGGSAYYRRT